MIPFHDKDGITIYKGDTIKTLGEIPKESVDLVWADPPFNLKKHYEGSGTDDAMPIGDYYRWCEEWIALAWEAMSPTGSFFVMTIQEHVGAMWKPLMAGGTFKNLIVWKNSSMPVKNRFCVAYQPILWFVKDPNNYTFNYGMERRQSNVVLPWGKENKAHSIRDIWEDIPFVSGGCIRSGEAILEPGTKRKRHPAQMPIKLARRVVGYCSKEGDMVADLFCGSGTMPLACSIMGRRCIGIEASARYCGDIVERLGATAFGEGDEETQGKEVEAKEESLLG